MLRERIDNPRWPHYIVIIRKEQSESNNPYKRGKETMRVIYEGKGRSYTDTTTTGNVNVEYNKRKAAIPVRFDAWAKADIPQDGDEIIARIGENEERGTVKDFEGDNLRSIVYWEFVRN